MPMTPPKCPSISFSPASSSTTVSSRATSSDPSLTISEIYGPCRPFTDGEGFSDFCPPFSMHLMNRTARNLLSILASILVVGVASAGLSLVVQYKPYGVPDHQRDEYEQTVAKIQRNKIEAQRLADLPRPKALISDRRH